MPTTRRRIGPDERAGRRWRPSSARRAPGAVTRASSRGGAGRTTSRTRLPPPGAGLELDRVGERGDQRQPEAGAVGVGARARCRARGRRRSRRGGRPSGRIDDSIGPGSSPWYAWRTTLVHASVTASRMSSTSVRRAAAAPRRRRRARAGSRHVLGPGRKRELHVGRVAVRASRRRARRSAVCAMLLSRALPRSAVGSHVAAHSDLICCTPAQECGNSAARGGSRREPRSAGRSGA